MATVLRALSIYYINTMHVNLWALWIYSIYLKIFPFEAHILSWLTQPQLLATRGGFVAQFWPSISWETHCFPDASTTASPSFSSCWNVCVLRDMPRRTWRLQGWQYWAIEPMSAISLPLNHSLNETNKPPLGELLNLGFLLFGMESNRNGYSFHLC